MRSHLVPPLLLALLSCQAERPPAPSSPAPPAPISTPTTASSFPTPSAAPTESDARPLLLSAYESPKTTGKDQDGFTIYVDRPLYDATNVIGVFPGIASPDAAVVHYLASRVRGDERYRETLTADCDRRCALKLKDHDGWKFLAFRLVGKKEYAPGRVWVKVWFEIEFEGRRDAGIDEFDLREEQDGYRILYVPT